MNIDTDTFHKLLAAYTTHLYIPYGNNQDVAALLQHCRVITRLLQFV